MVKMAENKRINDKGKTIHDSDKQPQQEKDGGALFTDKELDRQIAAIKAIQDMEIDHLLTGLRLIRSYFNDEQLQTPVLEFFQENLPNVAIVRNSEDDQFDLRWKDEVGNVDGGDIHASLYQHLGMTYHLRPSLRPSFGGYQFGVEMPECFQTPGAESQRLSIGMTPKTLRLPKHGEMLLSVHGSPLGVYKKEDNMEAIRELEEG